MEHKIMFEIADGVYKVPINEDMFRTNMEYYSEMGIYTDDLCREKALLVSGYRILK